MEPANKKRFPTFRYLYLNPEEFDGVVADGLSADSIPSDGGLLIGQAGAAPVVAQLQAGSGIGITNGPGSITVTNLQTSVQSLQAFSSVVTTTTSTTDTVVDSMTLAPTGPGGFFVSFSGVYKTDTDNQTVSLSIYRNGVLVPESLHELMVKKDIDNTLSIQAYLLPGTAQIDIRWRLTAGIGTFKNRNVIALERPV